MAKAISGQDIPALNYTVLIPFDKSNTNPRGGNPLQEDVNVYYQSGDIAWILTSTALVLLMTPGIGYDLFMLYFVPPTPISCCPTNMSFTTASSTRVLHDGNLPCRYYGSQ